MRFVDALVLPLRKALRFSFNSLKKFCRVQPWEYRFKHLGKNVGIGENFLYSGEENISIGDMTNIAPGNVMFATNAEIKIGSYVMTSPNVMIFTGNHRTDVIGEYMRNITEDMKTGAEDAPVVIEDDVWIGAGVIILKGVTIGRGSIIKAGRVVTKRVKPYTVYISEDLQISRFTRRQIEEHERLLKEKYGVEYPPYTPPKNLFIKNR